MSIYIRRKNIIFLFLIIHLFLINLLHSQEWNETYWEQLEIYRDNWGIPHIFSRNIRALGFGFGYTQAQDHWETMLLSFS